MSRSTETTTFSERVVTRLSTGLFSRRTGRRDFLTSTAVAGSALLTKPWQFLVQPVSAYSTVCGSGSSCGDGWTAFCCSVHGTNTCPPGSFVAGWWKADNSGFCCGSARYYIDCNAMCGSDWRCHCNNNGTCDQRKVACNQFRYGQCHQEVACYGPVVCRVATCVPPWMYDASCTAVSATDNLTASHSAPCLGPDCVSDITQRWLALGGANGALGQELASERADPTGTGRFAVFERGAVFSSPVAGLHVVLDAIWNHYAILGATASVLGFPVTDSSSTADGAGQYQQFSQGYIYTSPSGTFEIHGPIYDKWAASGKETGSLGYPTSDVYLYGSGRRSDFQHGSLLLDPATEAVTSL
ncbi:MAG: hypothetical protein JWL70_1317 [Acidimicrobiia bacterium]|nr:hypothetical protein [Acidimicrobiia bacterium]